MRVMEARRGFAIPHDILHFAPLFRGACADRLHLLRNMLNYQGLPVPPTSQGVYNLYMRLCVVAVSQCGVVRDAPPTLITFLSFL